MVLQCVILPRLTIIRERNDTIRQYRGENDKKIIRVVQRASEEDADLENNYTQYNDT